MSGRGDPGRRLSPLPTEPVARVAIVGREADQSSPVGVQSHVEVDAVDHGAIAVALDQTAHYDCVGASDLSQRRAQSRH